MRARKTSVLFTILLLSMGVFSVLGFAQARIYAQVTLIDSSGGHIYYDLTVPVASHGAGSYALLIGANYTFTAVPNAGYVFVNFTARAESGENSIVKDPINFAIDDVDFNLTAYFAMQEVGGPHVNVTLITTEGGNIFMDFNSPLLIFGLSAGSYSLMKGSVHEFSAFPSDGYVFDHFTITTNDPIGQNGSTRSNPLYWTTLINFNLTAYFTSGPTPTPVATPTATPENVDFLKLKTDMTTILELVIGCLFTFLAILIFAKAPSAWVAGVILLIAGFEIQQIALPAPSLMGLLAFALESIIFSVFLYSSDKRSK